MFRKRRKRPSPEPAPPEVDSWLRLLGITGPPGEVDHPFIEAPDPPYNCLLCGEGPGYEHHTEDLMG